MTLAARSKEAGFDLPIIKLIVDESSTEEFLLSNSSPLFEVIARGARVDECDALGHVALDYAVARKFEKLAYSLLRLYDAAPTMFALNRAINGGFQDLAEEIFLKFMAPFKNHPVQFGAFLDAQIAEARRNLKSENLYKFLVTKKSQILLSAVMFAPEVQEAIRLYVLGFPGNGVRDYHERASGILSGCIHPPMLPQ